MRSLLFFILLAPSLLAAQRQVQHFQQIPRSAERSLDAMAEYFVQQSSSAEELAFAIFVWTASNINYDLEALLGRKRLNANPENVLKSRTAVCEGFAGLYQSIADRAGLRCESISGYAKGFGQLRSGDNDTRIGHAWNAVWWDDAWHLIDPTWGSGYADSRTGRMVKELNTYYFDVSAEELIFSHFPDEENWQLLDHPLSELEFKRQPIIKAPFFELDLALLSKLENGFEIEERGIISFSADPTIRLLGQVTSQSGALGWVVPQRNGNQVSFHFCTERNGAYTLGIYAKRGSSNDRETLDEAFKIDFKSTSGLRTGFPTTFGRLEQEGVKLIQPWAGILKAGQTHDFQIEAPAISHVAGFQNGEWYRFTKSDASFTLQERLPKGDFQVGVSDDGTQFDMILQYQIK